MLYSLLSGIGGVLMLAGIALFVISQKSDGVKKGILIGVVIGIVPSIIFSLGLGSLEEDIFSAEYNVVASTKGDVYHYRGCSYIKQIDEKNIISGGVTEFKDEGYRACKVCSSADAVLLAIKERIIWCFAFTIGIYLFYGAVAAAGHYSDTHPRRR